MDEVKPKRGRPRTRSRTSILSDAQVAEIRGTTTEQEQAEKDKREAERQRGIQRRKEARVEKQLESVETKEALWLLNRENLPPQELDALLEKQEQVWDQLHWLNKVLSGTNIPPDDELYVGVEEGSKDLFDHVKEHGVVTMELVLLGEYWKEPIYTERFQGNDPDSVFARLGLVTALPSHKVHQFEQFLSQRAGSATSTATAPPPTTKPDSNGFTKLSCKCGSQPHAVPQEIADRYRELGQEYFCHRCLELERKSRQESVLYTRVLYAPGVPR
jgi:hypothetical protein